MQLLNVKKTEKGFTLIELMIVIAIVAILATIAIPSYQNYTKKAAVTELITAAASYKTAVEICQFNTGDLSKCGAGSQGIPANLTTKGKIKSLTTSKGVITVEGDGNLKGVKYVLTPPEDGETTWKVACSDTEIFPAGFCTTVISTKKE